MLGQADFMLGKFVIVALVAAVVLVLIFAPSPRRWSNELGRTCRGCGATHPAFARFCRRCGKQL